MNELEYKLLADLLSNFRQDFEDVVGGTGFEDALTGFPPSAIPRIKNIIRDSMELTIFTSEVLDQPDILEMVDHFGMVESLINDTALQSN